MAKSTASGSGIGTSIPAGVVMPFAGDASKIPVGWLLCDGRTVSRSSFRDLFNIIGTAWGEGDGSSTFHLPDMRGAFVRGVDKPDANPAAGRDPNAGSRTPLNTGGNSGDAVGSYQADAMQGHNHRARYNTATPGAAGGPHAAAISGGGIPNASWPDSYDLSSDPIADKLGNGVPRVSSESRPKNVAVNYIIKA